LTTATRLAKSEFLCMIKDLVYSTRSYREQDIEKMMFFRWSRLSYPPYRDDVVFKCVNCFHTLHRGYPITKEQYEVEVNLRQGRTFMPPTFETRRKKIRHKVEELSYIVFKI